MSLLLTDLYIQVKFFFLKFDNKLDYFLDLRQFESSDFLSSKAVLALFSL